MPRKSALCARLGRKPAIIIAAVVFTAGAVTMGAAGNKEVLLVGRIILGMGIGGLKNQDWSKELFISRCSLRHGQHVCACVHGGDQSRGHQRLPRSLVPSDDHFWPGDQR